MGMKQNSPDLNGSNTAASDISDINITPFVDVVLVLLVIFMVTAPAMISEQLRVKLPKTLTSDLKSPGSTVGLAITKEGQIIWNGEVIDKLNFEQKLNKLKDTNSENQFLISADVESRHGDLIYAIDSLKVHGLNNFALQVEKIQKK